MLEIRDLRVAVDGKDILTGLDLRVAPGEVHAIMGPNGSGKSTLAHVLAGRDGYEVTGGGEILFEGPGRSARVWRRRSGPARASSSPSSTRSRVPGVKQHLLPQGRGQRDPQAPRGARARRDGLPRPGAREARRPAHGRIAAQAGVNVGFSGGEKKRNEIFQLAIMEPAPRHPRRDRLRPRHRRAQGRREGRQRAEEPGAGDHPRHPLPAPARPHRPDRVHVLSGGRIATSGGQDLALELESRGYEWVREAAAGA